MKAIGKLERAPGLTLYDAPFPEMGPKDLLIRIQKTAICGTDINIYEWKEWAQNNVSTPLTIGHEFMGIVEEVGPEVAGFKKNDRVSGEGHIVCDLCRNCRAGKKHLCRNTQGVGYHLTGCFAEYFVLPAENAFLIPDEISDDIASIFDPLGNAVHTALSFDLVGEDVLITGAGPIGIMGAQIARHVGARNIVITDINEQRLKLAEQADITYALNPLKEDLADVMTKLKMSEGFDVGLEMSGSAEALTDMIDVMNHGGKIALLGILPTTAAVDWNKIIFNSLFLKGIYGREMFETWYKMVSMLQSGLDLSSIITHQIPYDSFESAFSIMKSGNCGKIVLDWMNKAEKKKKEELTALTHF